jgi:putative ABC transport system permease protein
VILKVFLMKALLLGLAGGIGGYLVGTLLAVTMGPRLAGVPVLPIPWLAFWAMSISTLIALSASYLPARRAARLDPTTSLQEI